MATFSRFRIRCLIGNHLISLKIVYYLLFIFDEIIFNNLRKEGSNIGSVYIGEIGIHEEILLPQINDRNLVLFCCI